MKHTSNTPVFDAVLARLRESLSADSDAQVAEFLGMKRNAFYNRKSSGSIPYEEIAQVCGAHNLSLDFILLGREKPTTTKSVVSQVNSHLLATIFAAFRRCLWPKPPAPQPAIVEAARIGHLVGTVYNDVANLDEPKQAAAVRIKVEEIASLMRIVEGASAELMTDLWTQPFDKGAK